ncbi:MAG: methylenetetrahydrofolate--tRNA-(uracil(54)-C(5))-methyltransferase (FADH(2)-oxidizing) TrmFO [Fusobacteria bacterium]|nr:methylenetetrahydrofolate--tRNA-(uracil(54)-C(5))-methyltransferase (FADH(2)-oxidizing) TrmFO [Fusobacteriota bacterium]
MKEVVIIGAGLAGSEAAYQLAKRGIKVKLYEMRPKKTTEVHSTNNFAELVCSNSLGSNFITNASGLLKEELRQMDSLLIKIADETKVPAGQALAVDRDGFSEKITEILKNNENIEIIYDEKISIDENKYTLIASGPLSSEKISNEISRLTGSEYLYFYDAVAPIVEFDSINKDKVYFASRYDKGEGEYINCPMDKEQYYHFYNELINGESAPLKEHEKIKLFEACMPVEKIAERGERTLLFGPLKAKGLVNPKTDKQDYAVVQLRQDDKDGKLYNLVGFQTNLKWGEQKRIFSLIPGLENADFVRYGVMHRNTFINSTKLLNNTLSLKTNSKIYFAGQITGSEGYVAAIATGLYAAENIYRKLNNIEKFVLDDITMLGAMVKYITEEKKNFQPMGPNFGIIRELDEKIRDKKLKYQKMAERSLENLNKKLNI